MLIPLYQVDAFTRRLFAGNPAAVCPLGGWLDDDSLHALAAENNLSETAFLVGSEGHYGLRWFTPAVEVDLCGHATLAAAHIVFTVLEPGRAEVTFGTASGDLYVRRDDEGRLAMDLPRRPAELVDDGSAVAEALGTMPNEVRRARDLLVVLETEADVAGVRPDFGRLAALDATGVIVTAAGEEVDFVSRFFAPRVGVPEDPVTGSAHCTLVPYWSERLGRPTLHARQISRRGGDLYCADRGDRVTIAGDAVTYLEGMVRLP